MSEEKKSGRERLEQSKSLKEILQVAISFEKTAHDFYSALIPKVGKNIRWLVEELAEEEKRHYDLFNELAARADLEQQMNSRVRTPASDHRFSDAVHLPELGEKPDDQAIMQYAMAREHAAMEQYGELATTVAPGPIQELFRFLADEETKHKQELEKVYYELIHSGGV